MKQWNVHFAQAVTSVSGPPTLTVADCATSATEGHPVDQQTDGVKNVISYGQSTQTTGLAVQQKGKTMNMNPTITDDNGRIVEYGLSLTVDETQDWADNHLWVGSTIAGHSLFVSINKNGLCECLIDGNSIEDIENISDIELTAIVTDHLPTHLRHLWPTWANIEQPTKAEG